jgi:hypothetical protein
LESRTTERKAAQRPEHARVLVPALSETSNAAPHPAPHPYCCGSWIGPAPRIRADSLVSLYSFLVSTLRTQPLLLDWHARAASGRVSGSIAHGYQLVELTGATGAIPDVRQRD